VPGPLVETKLYVPQIRQGLVARPRLSTLLARRAESRMTLVSAAPHLHRREPGVGRFCSPRRHHLDPACHQPCHRRHRHPTVRTPDPDVALAVGRSEAEVRELVKPQKRAGGFTRPQYLTYANKAKTHVKAIGCPHGRCRGRRFADHLALLPEVAASGYGVICGNCRRAPATRDLAADPVPCRTFRPGPTVAPEAASARRRRPSRCRIHHPRGFDCSSERPARPRRRRQGA
jgi:hypothetical protein